MLPPVGRGDDRARSTCGQGGSRALRAKPRRRGSVQPVRSGWHSITRGVQGPGGWHAGGSWPVALQRSERILSGLLDVCGSRVWDTADERQTEQRKASPLVLAVPEGQRAVVPFGDLPAE